MTIGGTVDASIRTVMQSQLPVSRKTRAQSSRRMINVFWHSLNRKMSMHVLQPAKTRHEQPISYIECPFTAGTTAGQPRPAVGSQLGFGQRKLFTILFWRFFSFHCICGVEATRNGSVGFQRAVASCTLPVDISRGCVSQDKIILCERLRVFIDGVKQTD